MAIREYFEQILNTEGFEAYCEAESALWEAMDDEDFDVRAWAVEHGVDLDAMGRNNITVFQYWCWDQED